MSTTAISTQAEARALSEQTPSPEPAPSLTPGSALKEAVHDEVEARRQRRITFIQNRLASASYRMRRDRMQAIRQ